MQTNKNPQDLLKSGSMELGIALSPAHLDSFFMYFAELIKWNCKINLTTITDAHEIIIKHALDSLSYLNGFSPSSGLMLLDMGSGAGFPALPIKIIHPEIIVTLVESIKKKAAFLRHIIRTLKLSSVEVLDKRTELLPDSFHNIYDVVTARAFADMKAAIITALPFLKKNGLIILSRGPMETIDCLDLEGIGVFLEKKINLILPYSDNKRMIWVFRKL